MARKNFVFIFTLILFTAFSAPVFSNEPVTAEEIEKEDKEKMDLDYEAEPVVVLASRNPQPISEVSKSITVVDEQEIQNKQTATVFEALREVPGLYIRQNGDVGRLSQVSLRGVDPKHTIVMLDGVKVNSPTTGDVNMADILSDNVESVEILRGAESTLYGSEAIGGVIDIKTKRGKGKPKITSLAEYGTLNTFRESVQSSGSFSDVNKEFYYSTSYGRMDSDGLGEGDDFEENYITARAGVRYSDKANLDVVFRYIDSHVGNDDSPNFLGQPQQDPNAYSDNNKLIVKPTLWISPFDWYEQKLKLSLAQEDLINEDPPDPGTNQARTYFRLDTSIYTLDWQHTVAYQDYITVTTGIELEDQEADNRNMVKTAFTWAWYFQPQLKLWDRLFLTGGLRVFRHNRFGRDATWQFSGAYLIKETNTKIRANYGQAFKAPTLNDLYWPGAGNPNLNPEESQNYDVGIEQSFFDDKLKIMATCFYNRIDEMIQWAPIAPGSWTWLPFNIGEARIRGVESEIAYSPIKDLTFKITYTGLNTKDMVINNELIRKPRHVGGLQVNYRFLDKFNINLNGIFVSKSKPSVNSSRKLRGYNKFDVALSYDVNKYCQVYGRVENLFNDHYSVIEGYPAAGTKFFGGVRLKFE